MSKAVKKANDLKISQVGDFKKRIGGIFELPSGLVVKLRNPGGMAAFTGNDTIPNSLMNIISGALDTNKGVNQSKLVAAIKEDPETIEQMARMLDSIALKSVVEPKLQPVPTEADLQVWNADNPENILQDVEELRSDEKLYVDELDAMDKQYIFQWITGGVKDLESFRKQLERGMAPLA